MAQLKDGNRASATSQVCWGSNHTMQTSQRSRREYLGERELLCLLLRSVFSYVVSLET